jgi:hypothetical protein
MNLTTQQINVIVNLHPNVVVIRDGIAYDAQNNEVTYDINAVNAKVTEDEQATITAKASALAKLTALGLTQAEVTALIG